LCINGRANALRRVTIPYNMPNDFLPTFVRKPKILIAEDEIVNREILAMYLSDRYEVLTADNGRQAMDLLLQMGRDIELILLDLLMPEMDGMTFLRQKRDNPNIALIPVIVLTSEGKMEMECLTLGAIDFIKKPYESPEIIHARVHRIIELYESNKTIAATSRDPLSGLFTERYFNLYINRRLRDGAKIDIAAIHLAQYEMCREILGESRLESIVSSIGELLGKEKNTLGAYLGDGLFAFATQSGMDFDLLHERILSHLSHHELGDRIRVQIGVYTFGPNEHDAHAGLSRAKSCLALIDEDLGNYLVRYDESLHQKALREEHFVQLFRKAMREREFVVYLQPKYAIQGDTPRLTGAEALVRWVSKDLGFVSPGEFIPLFESNGLIRSLDAMVHAESARILGRLRDEVGVEIPISVNVSRAEIYDPTLPTRLNALIKRYRIDKSCLHLEVTESSSSTDMETFLRNVQALHDLGYHIELDDFGAGYSSLQMLSTMPVDVLKVDMSLIRSMLKTKINQEIVRTILSLASIIGAKTVAEGVESKEQVDALRAMGCDLIQGYYFSKPLPEEEFIAKAKKEIGK